MTAQPARITFWRWTLAITALLAWISLREAFLLAQKLGLAPLSSKTWLVLLGALALTGLACLGVVVYSFVAAPPARERLLDLLEISDRAPAWLRWAAIPILLATLAAYPLITFQPYYGGLLGGQPGMRLFIFWALALAGMHAIRLVLLRRDLRGKYWLAALLVMLLFQATLQRILLYLPDISAYPFAMGWSETSRFFYPALFISKPVFGQSFAWPILHPTLHFVLVPPYLLGAPLWFHRFWQVAMRFVLVGLIAPALIQRLNIPSRAGAPAAWRWLTGIWIFLVLFTLPLYLHLAVPVFIILWGFSARDGRRTWFWLVLASIWAGLSRLNWYPVPGMLAAALYFLEVPAGKKSWSYLIKPALWFLVGTLIAFVSMQIYIALSGITDPGNFFTSLSSTKLWDRLWPNASYPLGVLPGSLIFSLPFWLVIFFSWKNQENSGLEGFGVARLMLLAELLVLFCGGLVVSMKIGGGADIHNMDAYAVLLLVITAYLLFGARQAEPKAQPALHWAVVALLVLVPGWFSVQNMASLWAYDPATSRATLTALQKEVDQVNAGGGEILFITQRHLISMHMLAGVKLVPEYEREELMEMAMAQNEVYLQAFRAELEKHRFAAIVVDPLRFNFVGERDAMGAENNAWTRYVVRRILCSYQPEAVFPADRIAIYTPQVGTQKCP
ncbi:MAG TPA: hypothetical protein VGK00_04610 [Anaerolineales bacterium]|jgi:hypothetical protein